MLRQFLFHPPILIYQMPKAGSQTIEATLQLSCPHLRLLRFHYASSALAATLRRGLRFEQANEQWREMARAQLRQLRRLGLALRTRRLLVRCGARLPQLQVITGVREPVAVALSSLFENYFHAFPTGPAALAACREAFLKPNTVRYIQDWFDLELKPMLGLDIYARPFDRQSGCAIYENALARVLVYRYEALNKLPLLLRQFLGVELREIASRNIGAAKTYAQEYKYVQEHLRLPPAFLTEQYESRMMRHFYSAAERKQFFRRWVELPAAVAAPQTLAA